MSFKVKVLSAEDLVYGKRFEEEAETAPLRGNVVLGRSDREVDYDDRATVEGVDVDNFVALPDSGGELGVSRNHLLVSENPGWNEQAVMDSACKPLETGDKGYSAWDLNGTGTEEVVLDDETGNPIYRLAEDFYVQPQPLNHFLGISGDSTDGLGCDNTVESAAENLDKRGFETATMSSPSWSEVDDSLEDIKASSEEDSTTYVMYSGHGTPSGDLCLDGGRVGPGEFIEKVSEIDGEKIMMIDSCHAGNFSHFDIPDDTTVYMASGSKKRTQGGVEISGETRTRYAGNVVRELEGEYGEVSMHDVHDSVGNVAEVASNGPRVRGFDTGVSRRK